MNDKKFYSEIPPNNPSPSSASFGREDYVIINFDFIGAGDGCHN
jgi:hypothetical protein